MFPTSHNNPGTRLGDASENYPPAFQQGGEYLKLRMRSRAPGKMGAARGSEAAQYSSASMIVSTRVVFSGSAGSSEPNRISASYASIFQKNFRPVSVKFPKSCSFWGSLS